MAMARVCDMCGRLVSAPFKQLKVLTAESEDTEPRNYRTIRSIDLHNDCYDGLDEWMAKRMAERVARDGGVVS